MVTHRFAVLKQNHQQQKLLSKMVGKLSLTLASFLSVGVIAAQVNGQVVMLPTGQMTSIGTTANVPDGGFILLGNMHYGAEAMMQRGLPGVSYFPITGMATLLGQRAISFQQGETQIYLGVRIHDFKALDQVTFLKGRQIMEVKRAAGLIPAIEKPLPGHLPAALRHSFSSEQ